MTPTHHGQIPSFDERYFLACAQILVDADEPERALHLLTDGLPAYYRDNPTQSIIEYRKHIQSALMTPLSYLDCSEDSLFCEDTTRAVSILKSNLRGKLMLQSITNLNEKQIIPHLIEVGPGEYWLPIALRGLGLQFTYKDVAVNEYTKKRSENIRRADCPQDSYVIFCAQEVIEHLANPSDLAIELMRETNGRGANEIHVSTPLYTYDGHPKPITELKRNGLPHLRAYTPNEFLAEGVKIFGASYNWELQVSQVMSLVGIKR